METLYEQIYSVFFSVPYECLERKLPYYLLLNIKDSFEEGIRNGIILTILDEHFVELQPLFKTHEFCKRTSVGASAIVARKSI